MNTKRIKLDENVYWAVDSATQDESALEWVNENVTKKLGVDDSDPDFISPEKDTYGRPVRWVFKGDTYTIEIVREYIYPNSGKWAKKGDIINVESNE